MSRSEAERRPRLIVTADDFGRDAVCTQVIADSLERGKITATSIMANGACFKEACALAYAKGLIGKIGVHLVLDEGPPLSQQMKRFADSNGNLCVRRSLRPLGRALARAVEAELSAQIERVVQAGIRPSHLDSHRHIHTVFPIGRLVVKLARRFAIPYVRPARNLAQTTGMASAAYKWLFNRYVTANVGTARHFGDIEDFCQHDYRISGPVLIECMIHLDGSPRGLSGQRLLENAAYRRVLEKYALVDHAHAGS